MVKKTASQPQPIKFKKGTPITDQIATISGKIEEAGHHIPEHVAVWKKQLDKISKPKKNIVEDRKKKIMDKKNRKSK